MPQLDLLASSSSSGQWKQKSRNEAQSIHPQGSFTRQSRWQDRFIQRWIFYKPNFNQSGWYLWRLWGWGVCLVLHWRARTDRSTRCKQQRCYHWPFGAQTGRKLRWSLPSNLPTFLSHFWKAPQCVLARSLSLFGLVLVLSSRPGLSRLGLLSCFSCNAILVSFVPKKKKRKAPQCTWILEDLSICTEDMYWVHPLCVGTTHYCTVCATNQINKKSELKMLSLILGQGAFEHRK